MTGKEKKPLFPSQPTAATKCYEDKKAVGFISHMDTAPDFSGKNVKPQIIPDYNGEDVILK